MSELLELEHFLPNGHLREGCRGTFGAPHCRCSVELYRLAERLEAELVDPGWWVRFSYWIRPYDSHFDGRCWRWRRVLCRPWVIR